MKTLLLSATVLMGLSAPAWAALNDIRIDATSNSGSVTSLSITQDATNLGNQVSGNAGGTTAFPMAGSWGAVSINQQGGTNKLYGAVTAAVSSTTSSLTASYIGGKNTHSLTIGGTTAPVNPVVAIAVNNTTGVGTNTITDTLDGTALTYNLAIAGTGNTLTNSVGATGAITLTQGGGGYGITGSTNTISNTVSGVNSFTHNLTLAGSGNTITNTASGGGDKTITQSIASSGNTVAVSLTGTGLQTAALTSDSGSTIDFSLTAPAANSAANFSLSNVVGAGGIPAVVSVTQTAAANNATANLTLSGGIYTTGASLTGGAGVYVYQNSPSAYLNASVTAAANGYTVNFTQ